MPGLLDMPLQRKIGLLVLVGLLLMFGLFGLLGALLADDHARQTADERLVIAQLTVSFLDSEIEEQFRQLETAAALAADATDDLGSQQHLLRDLLRQPEPFVTSVFLTDRTGRLRWAEPAELAELGADLSSYPHVRAPLATGARYVSGVHTMGATGNPTAVLAVPVIGPDGVPVGVLGAAIDPNHRALHDLVAAARQLGQTGHAELVDQVGRVIVSSEPSRVLEPGEHPEFYRPLLERRASDVGTTGPIGDEDAAERGQRHVMAFVPLVHAPWGLLLGGSEAEFLALAHRWLWLTAIVGGLSLVIALFLVWVTTRSVARPVQALTTASRRIAAGDLATPVPSLGEGEVRALAEAFDDMRRHLRQALEALAVEKSRYQAIVGSMADAVFTTDAQLRVTAFNPAAEALTGRSAAEVLGRPCLEVVRPVDDQGKTACSDNCPLLRASSAASPTVAKETIRRRDGRAVVVATARSAIHDHSGTLAGVVHVLRDISAEEELSRLKDEFLSTVSHELRTPLSFVKGYASTLLLPDGPRDEATTRRCLQVIVEASDELQELVDNLLDMSRIGAGALSVEPQPVRLEVLARAAVERARVRAQGHRVQVAVTAGLPLVSADPHRIEQVLYNLLDNAIKYSPEGGRVTIAAEAAAAEVLVSVADEGLGIPPEEMSGLFERFHRGKTARARHIGGSGLGLAICKGIVAAHGGCIWAESPVPGRPPGALPGTVICFTLPTEAGRSGCAPPAELRASGATVGAAQLTSATVEPM
ncbi:MAG: PAS domain S-box protein [Chloroflexi bacterium]|nr:PAS domain S-box protein [Chloroflexota bacterium]